MEEALEADRQFLGALQELIVLATDVLDLSVDSLISRPTACVEIIRKLQKTGQYWDEHEDWPGRDWYVDILMAVASLGRVLEWWEAEKGFWNFDDDKDDNEPLTFVLRPAKEAPHFELEPSKAASVGMSPLALAPKDPSQSTATLTQPAPMPEPSDSVNSEGEAATQTQTTEDLRVLAEQAKSVNIVMELSLQGEEIIYVNDAILEVIGRDPEEVLDRPIADLLAPADTSHFTEATENLLQDDGNTVQLRFRFEVHDVDDENVEDRPPGPVYIELEGVGMLMRENNEPSHTMWVMRPVTATQVENITEAAFPRDGVISTEGVLCRICEREIVVWFFEKHNETCDAVHRGEAEVTSCDECLLDLQKAVNLLIADLNDGIAQDATQPLLGVVFFSLPESVSNSQDMPDGSLGVEVRKVSPEQLQDVAAILAVARQIETPSVLDDEADLPFTIQRYLSPQSEDKLLRVTRWQKPQTTDRALQLLYTRVEDQLRRKQKAIARMQSTIRYSEKTRHEWEDKVNQMLEESEDGSASESGSETTVPILAQDASDTPGLRKIAPLARLPITQGHPQRQWQRDIGAAAPPSPPTAPPAAVSILSPAAPLQPLSTLEIPAAKQGEQPLLSPLLKPTERKSHHGRRFSIAVRDPPMSPRIPSGATAPRPAQPSIKDFEIIKPISRGAFGSVYLAKKVATGDYYAIKALKKSDMIAKNQITNVKAERTILMNQASSPYVVKLFFSFQSKEYLYLVMEYLNGGDCATLVKTLGELPLEWARNYIAELVLGLEYLHARNVAHRGSESAGIVPKHMRQLSGMTKGSSDAGTGSNSGAEPPRFVGTPDYLSPESILGGGTDDRMVDWWAVGVVLYEFLYGIPPFHAETPEKVFDNIISRRINWHDDEIELPMEARDLMDRLICTNPALRLGARGADEVKQHAFFAGVNWDALTTGPALFVPDGTDPESTDYFDPRGAVNPAFQDEDMSPKTRRNVPLGSGTSEVQNSADDSTAPDDFGAFNFKNLPVLKQANDDVIRRMRSSSNAVIDFKCLRPTVITITVNLLGSLDSFSDRIVANSNCFGSVSTRTGSASDRSSNRGQPPRVNHSSAESMQLVASPNLERPARGLDVLIAEDNPISQKILETLLTRMGCRCVCAHDGSDALAQTMGSIKFDLILCDIHMPYISGEQVARMIRSTNNHNQNTPIIAATSYDQSITEEGTLFSAVLAKPFSKSDLSRCLAKVGFVLTSSTGGTADAPNDTAATVP
ncbi:rim15, signal transduction response regulator [Vanrija albida]|uniref:non-specific serine/threonine protein kinase n=1 Tax=Vanrija albida TaxID=181172 RepID=A0ABR3PST5_9TREE